MSNEVNSDNGRARYFASGNLTECCHRSAVNEFNQPVFSSGAAKRNDGRRRFVVGLASRYSRQPVVIDRRGTAPGSSVEVIAGGTVSDNGTA
jgi:hypothetical protein